MADLSKIKLNGTEYDLKDATAREEINNIESEQLTASKLKDSDFTSNIIYSVIKEESNNFSLCMLSSFPPSGSESPLDVFYFLFSYLSAADKVFFYQLSEQPISFVNLHLTDVFMDNDGNNFFEKFRGIKLQGIDDLNNLYTFIFERDENNLLVGQLEEDKIVVKSNLATVATSGNYNDLTHKPTIPNVPAWALASTKPTYTANEVGALPDTTVIPTIPTDISTFNNDTGYLTSYTETDPIFTASAAAGISSTDITNWNAKSDFSGNYNDLTNKPTIPEDKIFPINVTLTSMAEGTSDKTHNEIVTAVNAGKIPFVYIDYLGIKMIAPLARVESNYSVFTYEDQTVPDNFNYARLKIQNSTATIAWRDQYATSEDFIAYLENNNYISSNNISSYETDPTVPAWAKQASKPTYSFSELTSHPTTINDYGITDAYTKTEINGLISSVLHYKGTKATVSALPDNDNVTGDVWHITADGSEWAWDGSNWQELGTAVDLSAYRTVADQNSIDSAQNTAIAAKYSKPSSGIPKSDLANDVQTSLGKADTALQSYTETDPVFTASAAAGISSTDISNWNAKSNFSGSYNDLEDKPTIPAAQVNADWDATSGVAQILNKPTIPNVPAWALAASKPTYTASEVGALPSTYTAPVTSVNGQTGAVNLTIPAATTVTNTLASGTLIATINGTNVYAPAYTDADGVSY